MIDYVESSEYRYFIDKVKSLTGIDLGNYKPWQIQRRLTFIMEQAGASTYEEYISILARDNEKLTQFVDWITINVSEFYRDTPKFKELQNNILPQLLTQNKVLRIWSAGCSNGSEPYTLALILEELTPGVKHTIIGTDLDNRILRFASEGRYQERDVRNIPRHLFQRFFTVSGSEVILSDEIKRRVTFKKHDLLKDPYEKSFDLVLCRNVVIYFTNEAKDRIYRQFWSSLNDQGVLFVGGAESILNSKDIGFKVIMPFFYLKDLASGGLDVKRAS